MKKWFAVILTLLVFGALAVGVLVNVPLEDKHYHTYEVVLEATCIEEGVSECECGQTKALPLVAHNWQAEDCTSDYECVNCGAEKTMDMNGPHVDNDNNGVCEVCCRELPGHTHVYDVVLREVTCTEDGVYECACRQNTIDVPALGHDFMDDGGDTHTCQRCKLHESHNLIKEVIKEPTCSTTGIEKFSCECGIEGTHELSILNHSVEDGMCVLCLNIIFTIDGVSYSVPEGQTWGEWVESHTDEYQVGSTTHSHITDEISTISSSGIDFICVGYTPVKITDIIVRGTEYRIYAPYGA